MSDSGGIKKLSSQLVVLESTESWIADKSKEELLADLRTYLERLKNDPRSIPDRLRVAALQLRLGRIDEALIHYQGVVSGFVSSGQIMSAIALCQRILGTYPDLKPIKKILAALYARAPRGATGAPSPVTPIEPPPVEGEAGESSFLLDDIAGQQTAAIGVEEDAGTERQVVVDRLFPESRRREVGERRRALFGTTGQREKRPSATAAEGGPASGLEEAKTTEYRPEEHGLTDGAEKPLLLTQPKQKCSTPLPAAPEEPVVLLTRPKPTGRKR